jgi:hypothetical protein
MTKFFSFASLVIFLLILTSFSQPTSDSVRINIAVLDTANAETVSLIVEIKNLSVEMKKTLKKGSVDYVKGKIKAIGNYIVDVEKFEDGKFEPFPPTEDIDPVFEKEDYLEIKPNGFLMETINLNGRSWNSKGFPKGKYRVRVAFNWDEWSSSLENRSKWIAFAIR